MMQWQEVILYLGLAVSSIAAGKLHIISNEMGGSLLSMLVSFVVGRMLPAPGQQKKDGGSQP